MPIYLVRQGETTLNVARVLQPADTPLSPQGLVQAEAIARRLAGLGIAAIASSDLPRAARTAEAIAAATGAPVHWRPALQERNFGDLRGRAYDTLGFDPQVMIEAPPGGESAAAFAQRVAEAFADVLALRASLPGALAVVTHGLVIRALIESLPGAPALAAPIANTGLSIVAARPPHAVSLLGCIAHLDGEARGLSGG